MEAYARAAQNKPKKVDELRQGTLEMTSQNLAASVLAWLEHEDQINPAFWLGVFGAALLLATSGWGCIAGVDHWRNRRDYFAVLFLSIGAISCWSAIGIIAWLNWP